MPNSARRNGQRAASRTPDGRRKEAGMMLKAWRLAECLTQAESARKTGSSIASWSEWEAGKKVPTTIGMLMSIELTTGIPMETWSADPDAERKMRRLLVRRSRNPGARLKAAARYLASRSLRAA